MINKLRLIRSKIATILVVLMCINSFGAVVGDNDGAAFITKAEFESLKNDFQTQINRYNISLDSKIDGAISNYLDGINVKKTKIIKNLIENYDEIMWQRNWKLYGNVKEWTDNTTYTTKTDEWLEPKADKRINLRYNTLDIWDHLASDYGTGVLNVNGAVSTWGPGIACYGVNQYNRGTCPILFCYTDKINGKLAFADQVDFLCNSIFNNGEIWTIPTGPYTKSGQRLWEIVGNGEAWEYTDGTLSFNSVDDDSDTILDYDFGLHQASQPTYAGNYNRVISLSNGQFPPIFVTRNLDEYINLWNGATTAYWNTDTSKAIQDYSVGWHFYCIPDYKTEVLNSLQWLMLGDDCQTQLNYAYQGDSPKINGRKMYYYEDKSYLKFDVVRLNTTTSRYMLLNQTEKFKSISGVDDVRVAVPLYPRASISNIYNRHFSYDDKLLQIGQGIPIIIESTDTGVLYVTFDYDVNYVLDDSDQSRDLYVSVKKSDYMSTSPTDDYAEGYTKIVNVDTTTETIKQIKKVEFTADLSKLGQVALTIPVKAGESLWLRICPKDASGGHYAKMSNLQLTLESNS